MAECGIGVVKDNEYADFGTVSDYFELINAKYGAPEVEAILHNVVGTDGSILGSRKFGGRYIEITFDIQDNDLLSRATALQKMRDMCNANYIPTLTSTEKGSKYSMRLFDMNKWPSETNVSNGIYGVRYLNVYCVDFPEATDRDWWEDITVTFYAPDPAWKTSTIFYTKLTTNGTTTFPSYPGTAPTYPVIEHSITSPITNPTWTLHTGDAPQEGDPYIMLQGTVGPGELVIDCNKYEESVTLDGEDITIMLALDSTFFREEPLIPADGSLRHKVTCENGADGRWLRMYRWI